MTQNICQTQDFSFEHPTDWIDRSVIVRSAPPGVSSAPPNLVIAYDRLTAGETLGIYVNRQASELARSAQGFQLELRRDIVFAGRDSVELIFTWGPAIGMMRQRQVYALLQDGRLVSIGCTALAGEFGAAEPMFNQMLSSFRWK